MTRQRLLLGLLVLYLAALAASHVVRHNAVTEGAQVPRSKRVAVVGENISIAYREFGRPTRTEAPVPTSYVVLLHGSPGSSSDFLTLGPALANRFRVLAPDLPGFGDSTRSLSNYSIRAHAGQVLELLDNLAIESTHVVGFSMGGGVALEMARQDPQRLRSLTLLSSIGVQELELLGDYRLNHAVHGLQLAAIWALQEGFPHFGLLDRFPLDVAYARNFFDSDQRPLRTVLERLDLPTLIIHGENDVLVPATAAREHHRLVPQSELLILNESHFMVFGQGNMLARPISDFITRVEAGEALTGQRASAERIEAASLPFDASALPQASGLALVVLMLLLAVATFASEDLASIGTGLLVAQGRVGFFAGAAACFLGILVGDIAIYLAGRFLGKPWLGRAPLQWLVSPNAVEKSRQWFARKGPSVIFASRFLPGTRVATYFVSYLGSAVALWVPLIVGCSSMLGTRVFDLFDIFSNLALPGIVSLAIVGWLLFRSARTLFTRDGRRRLVGRWLRLRHWEFWPPWAFYPPVVLRVIWLGVCHRNLTLFTAANPAIPASGFIGESKTGILTGLQSPAVARHRVVPASLPVDERLRAVRYFMHDYGLDFPIVLKPDVGQRGSGVAIARTDEEIGRTLKNESRDLIVQEFVGGVELGVFYYRLPGEKRGRIFSITEKHLPEIVGNGSSTVEELILNDDRAVAMAAVYVDRLASELDGVPEHGERIRLVEVGTHCRGAVFVDGIHLKTAELEAAVDEISQSYEGFFFGRYDLKAPDHDAFRRGEQIRVVELNGVTSEATHIYDPDNSLFDAYRTLFRQWDLAFEIGAKNAANGAPVTPARELLRMLWNAWRN
jgi:pimeloyl-ACP methyl ester carboxylesterase/membrane protein DedA with SNARE-associated domain